MFALLNIPLFAKIAHVRNPQRFPLGPPRLVYNFDRASHDLGGETRNEAPFRQPEIGQPGIDDRVIAEEVASGSLVLERHRPGCEVPAKAHSLLWIDAPRHVSFQHDETIDEIRTY